MAWQRLFRKNNFYFALLVFFSGCSLPATDFHSLLENQPYVLEIDPPAGKALESPVEFHIRFSARVGLGMISPEGVALMAQIEDLEILQDPSDLMKGLKESTLVTIPLQFFLDAEETGLTVSVDGELPDGVYHIVVTPALLSVQGVPFNQKPGQAPTPFIAEFFHGDPALAPQPGDPGPGSGEIFGPLPEFLAIQEFLYDGLASETDGEAFVELYGSPGADISLYQVLFVNGSDGAETERVTLPPGSLLDAEGIFLIADLKTNSSTESRITGADFLDHFDPQNGPDGLQLLDREGNLVDTVVYGTGAALQAQNGLALGEGSPAPDVVGGHSLSRIAGADTQDNGVDFTDLAVPTPGII